MLSRSKWRSAILAAIFAVTAVFAWQGAAAQDDVVHIFSGVVKHVDKATKTVVIKSADGTEETIKYTDKTVVEGTKDAGKGVGKAATETYLTAKKGATVTVKYTGKDAEKTATAVKDATD